MQNLQKIVTVVIAVVALAAIGYLLYTSNNSQPQPSSNMAPMMMGVENFAGAPSDQVSISSGLLGSNDEDDQDVQGSESIQYVEQPQGLTQLDSGSQMNQLPSECYPKDVLSSIDLLPKDANSPWAQVSPSGQGSLADQNFLTAGFHIGINTVGQTLRNANRQLRSEPLNPQVKVSPWMQTTIEPDINRKPLEIGSADL
jgi:hypothetical protein